MPGVCRHRGAVTVTSMQPVTLPFSTKVVGISQYQAAAGRCVVQQAVRIEHEPGNAFDTNACCILSDDVVLGYIPRTLAARLVARGEHAWAGTVVAVHDGKGTIGVEVRIETPELALDTAPVECPVPSGATAPAPARRVVATKRSGRVLGALVRVDRDQRRVIVAVDGAEVPYPDGLVVLVDARS